jgi:hypothetical protein
MDIIGSPLVFSSEDICFDLELGVEAWFKNWGQNKRGSVRNFSD